MPKPAGRVNVGVKTLQRNEERPSSVVHFYHTGVMAGPLHLHTFACCQTELLLTASRADCLPGPRPNPVGMVTRHGKACRSRLAARPISFDESST
eukprot:superscaffoldBa00000451_g4825